MKSRYYIPSFILLVLLTACSKNSLNRLLGDEKKNSDSGVAAAGPIEKQIFDQVVQRINDNAAPTAKAIAMMPQVGCSSGPVITSSYSYTITPQSYSSSFTYTSGGVNYFTGYQYQNTGATILVTQKYDSNCYVDYSMYGKYSMSGIYYYYAIPQNGGQPTIYTYSYNLTYDYKGDVLEVSGFYSSADNNGWYNYPVSYIYPI